MSRDPLNEAIRALREEGEEPAPQAKLTRERILRDLRPRAKSRRWVWAVPVAALLAGSTVLAATGQLPALVETAARVLSGKPEPAKPRTVTPPRATASAPDPGVTAQTPVTPPEPPPAVAPPADGETAPGTALDPAKPARAEAPPRRATRGADAGVRARPVAEEPAAPAPAVSAPVDTAPKGPETDETLALYRKAHRLHFVEQNPGAALAAWDEYLAKGPRGPLVVDARYDRALCLVRLGRRAEARSALEPFADGRYGSYRQKEAKALLEALQSP